MPSSHLILSFARSLITAVLLLLGLALPAMASPRQAPPTAQTATANALLRVFLDCDFCDETYLRQNVTFVDYVRDRAVADVHVLVTTQGTGGGGTFWTVNFLGNGSFDGQNRVLTFSSPQAATADERRTAFARIFRLGLAGYAASTSAAPDLDVTFRRSTSAASATPARDPWNYWVFRVNGNGSANGQASSRSSSYRVSGSAGRTTEDWKIALSLGRNLSRSEYDVDEDRTVVSSRHGWNVNSLVVKSLTGRWSAGMRASAEHSSFSNTDIVITAAPALEFDLFPYAESSRRSLTLQYSIGASHLDYREVTVFDKLTETVPHHAVTSSLGLRQPWGNLGASASVSQHLNHLDRRRVSLSGNADIRLLKGLSFNVYGEYAKISDQISLRKGDATAEEVLLSLQQLSTGYSYYTSFGISYSFGSIFNSVVNPRLNGSGALSF